MKHIYKTGQIAQVGDYVYGPVHDQLQTHKKRSIVGGIIIGFREGLTGRPIGRGPWGDCQVAYVKRYKSIDYRVPDEQYRGLIFGSYYINGTDDMDRLNLYHIVEDYADCCELSKMDGLSDEVMTADDLISDLPLKKASI